MFFSLFLIISCSPDKECNCPFSGKWCEYDLSKNQCRYFSFLTDTIFELREFRDNCEFVNNNTVKKWASDDCIKFQITSSDGLVKEYEVTNLTDTFMYLKTGSFNLVYKRVK